MTGSQDIKKAKIRGRVRMFSDVEADQSVDDIEAQSLEMILQTKSSRDLLAKELNRLANEVEFLPDHTQAEVSNLKSAAKLAGEGKPDQLVNKLKAISNKVLAVAEKIGVEVAAKAIEHAIGVT